MVKITGEMLKDYPLAAHTRLYQRFAQSATALSLINVPNEDAVQLLELFTRVISLTLQDIQGVIRKPKDYPIGLRSVRIIQCRINDDFFNKWLPELQLTLKDFHLEEDLEHTT